MSKIAVNEITDEVGTGAPAFPNGMSATGAALTDPEVTGGIYLGGTGSANYLDDYEEGTWTPTLNDAGNTGFTSGDFVVNYATYTKTGDTVTVFFDFELQNSTASPSVGDYFSINNLPFSTEGEAYSCSGMIRTNDNNRLALFTGGSGNFNSQILWLCHYKQGVVYWLNGLQGSLTYKTNS